MTSTNTDTRAQFKILGVNDDVTVCGECGRENLRKTVVLMPLDVDGNEDGSPYPVGTDCAARLLGYTSGRMRGTIKAAETHRWVDIDNARDLYRVWAPTVGMDKPEQAAYWVKRHPEDRDDDALFNAARTRRARKDAFDEIERVCELYGIPVPEVVSKFLERLKVSAAKARAEANKA